MSQNIFLSLGIDPNAAHLTFSQFKLYLKRHNKFLDAHLPMLKTCYLKIQLAFFLRFGSAGMKLLEKFVDQYRDHFTIIIDGKFNDIQNSMQGHLDFVFQHLKAHGVTINPFLGENTLEMSFESCAKHAGSRGRVFVLCATSESSASTLSYLQENWKNKLIATATIRDKIFSNQKKYAHIAGVVIGANKEKILLSRELADSQLSVLVPGLGAQGGNWNLISQCAQIGNEFIFNIGRDVFDGGRATLMQMTKNFERVQKHFRIQD
jgi:orotidine-5'-phosphate decarboxylase